MAVKRPQPTWLSKKETDEVSQYFAEKTNFKAGDDIEALVKRLGGKIVYQDIDEWFASQDGSIVVSGCRNFIIYVSRFTGPLRNRFTIAHELAHYVLHSQFGKKQIQAARGESNRAEWEANWFAAGLLMPKDEFLGLWSQHKDERFLSGHFLVSIDAVKNRLRNLIES